MQSSGVKVSDEVVQKYNELKSGRASKYVIFKINDTNTEVVVEKVIPCLLSRLFSYANPSLVITLRRSRSRARTTPMTSSLATSRPSPRRSAAMPSSTLSGLPRRVASVTRSASTPGKRLRQCDYDLSLLNFFFFFFFCSGAPTPVP